MSDHAHRPNEPHDPHHSHGHGHDHAHAHDHDHGSAPHHHPRPAPQPATTVASLLMSSAWLRLVGAAALTACLWLAVAWALAGTP